MHCHLAITCVLQFLQAPLPADGEENPDPEAEAILADRPSKVVITDYTVCFYFCLYLHISKDPINSLAF